MTKRTEQPERLVKRRDVIIGGAGAVGAAIGGAILAGLPAVAIGQPNAPAVPERPTVPDDPTKVAGAPTSPVGSRSPFEKPVRTPTGEITGNSLTPLEKLTGTITPSDLHFERHHAGIPAIDPERHTLMVHGLVREPMVFTLNDLKRFPQVCRTHFIECAGNSRNAYRDPKRTMTPQRVAGQTSNTEWTGVPLATLFREVGVKPEATWFLAEGADACKMTRSVPVTKAFDDALIVWAQNGEPLRPETGYPLRLLLPGWEGNINVKWIHRIELGTQPWMTRWETSKYTDPLPNGTARRFTFEQDVKSLITSPAHPGKLDSTGWHAISGLAWSGRGSIVKVEVSTDGGNSWQVAELLGPVYPKAHVRFQHMWRWTGSSARILSRATDDTGAVQPTRTALVKERGLGTDYHYNQIVGWDVESDGSVFFFGES